MRNKMIHQLFQVSNMSQLSSLCVKLVKVSIVLIILLPLSIHTFKTITVDLIGHRLMCINAFRTLMQLYIINLYIGMSSIVLYESNDDPLIIITIIINIAQSKSKIAN